MNNGATRATNNEFAQVPDLRDRAASTAAESAFDDEAVNILIVDDEPKNLTVLEIVLDDPSYRLVRAESADQALLALVAQEFALLILDIRMPGMTGLELAQMIKNRKKTAQVPIIFLTAYYNEDQHVLEGYHTGAVDYLHKPVNPTILRSKVAVFVELHRKNRECVLANTALSAEVTERRKAEEQLRELNESLDRRVVERSLALVESEERYHILFNSMDEGFCIVEVLFDERENPIDYRFIEVNPAFEKQTGLKDVKGQRMRDLVPQLEQHWFDIFGRIAKTGDPARFEQQAAGLGRWYEVYAFGVSREAGRYVGIVFNDITERVRAIESLRISEKRLRAIYDGTHEYMGLLTPDGTVREVNRACLEFAGNTREEVIGLPFWNSDWFQFTPGAPELVRDAIVRAAAGESVQFETLIITPTGETRFFDISFDPVQDEMGEVSLLVPIGFDITERKAAEEALKEADRRKDEFVAMLAHELRNPLAAIANAVKLLRLMGRDNADLAWGHDIIDRQTNQLTRLINDLLDVSRITRGKVQLQRQTLDLRDVVRQAVEGVQPFFDAKKHHLNISMPETPLLANADAMRMEQVFGNLLTNAAKYTNEGGRITVNVAREGNDILILFRDTGVGIGPEPLLQIFDLFTQVDTSLDRAQGGLGIGLTVVKTLVEMHDGSVSVKSDGRGHGSEFAVRIPMLIQDDMLRTGVRSDSLPPPERLQRGPTCRVLVVDDNVDAAQSMASLLKCMGYESRTAHDGPEALDVAREYRPVVMLLDIGLPGLNGFGVAQAIRKDECLKGTKLVALSGYGQEQDRIRARESGMDHYLVKPVALDSLISLLDRLQSPASKPSDHC
jgi:PAS domain S-box-containing protein